MIDVWLFFFFHAIAAKEVGQILREGCTRHDRVATRFNSLGLQISLKMGEETDDGGTALQLGLELGNQRKGLGVRVVEVEDDEAWTILFLAGCESADDVLLVLDEGHLDSELARGLLNLRDKEEIFDEEEDLGGRVGWNGNGAALRVVDGLGVALVAASTAVPVAATLVVAVVGVYGGGRSVGEVSVDGAIAVVHGADEAARATLLLLASLALEAAAAV